MRRWKYLKPLCIAAALFLFIQFFVLIHLSSNQGDADTHSHNGKIVVELLQKSWTDSPLFLLEPSILSAVSAGTNSKEDCVYLCNNNKVITFGIIGNLSKTLSLTVHKLRQDGFSAVDSSDEHPDSLTKENRMPVKITTHIFVQHMKYPEPTIHIVVFYNRKPGFLWHSQIQIATSDIAFGSTAGAYEPFNLQKKTIDNVQLHVPSPITTFLQQVPHSEFIECNYARAEAFYLKNPRDKSEQAIHFQRKARQLISIAQKVLDGLGIRFWISSGTTLGWFRQCDIIPYSQDVDLGIWIKDYKPEMVQAFEKAGLPLRFLFGKVEDSYQMAFLSGEVKLDIFFFYEDDSSMWNAATVTETGEKLRYVFPRFKLCWTTLLEIKVRIPCPTQPYIEANYGNQWQTQIKTWDWKSSAPNVRHNGYWPKDQWEKVIQMYE
ncbi:ribitol-5-phosphate transferase FKTN-like [Mytilus edulis]|uniref:ribitol-5-phosphate transferase FKTN-like n=1 Tax=Mytilus edulis TaxID=6550 RepID=UPI0039EFF833